MSTITLELPNDLAQQLEREAAKQGVDPVNYILATLASSLPALSEAPPTEADLLQQINLGLSQEAWQTYHGLVAKRRAETLTPEEHQALIQTSTQLEHLNVQRMQALIQLSNLRHQPLLMVMRSLGISLSPQLLDEDESAVAATKALLRG
jgi:uncharacterized protein (DUF2461 family)